MSDLREAARDALLFIESLPMDLGRGSLNGLRVQIPHAINAALSAEPAQEMTDLAEEVQALRDALAVWEGEHCGGDCLAAPCSHCDGTCRTTGKGARLQNELDEAREELAADRASRLPEMGEGDLADALLEDGFKREEDWFVKHPGEEYMEQIHIDTLTKLSEAYKALVRGKA